MQQRLSCCWRYSRRYSYKFAASWWPSSPYFHLFPRVIWQALSDLTPSDLHLLISFSISNVVRCVQTIWPIKTNPCNWVCFTLDISFHCFWLTLILHTTPSPWPENPPEARPQQLQQLPQQTRILLLLIKVCCSIHFVFSNFMCLCFSCCYARLCTSSSFRDGRGCSCH